MDKKCLWKSNRNFKSMKTIKELIEPITLRGIKLIICVDTSDFESFYKSQGSPDGDFHKKIWRPFMCELFMDGPYCGFDRIENPGNLLEEWINKFLDEYPEFDDEINFMFTN